MTDDTTHDAFPVTVMAAVLWSFGHGEQFSDPAEFNRRVSEYHVQVTDEDTWDPEEVVFPAPALRVAYFGLASPGDDEYTDFEEHLRADDGARFTAGELLVKLNNAAAPHLKGVDHCFYEGLYLTDAPLEDGVPLYEMMQGS
jgi:hypothetical protein